MTGNLWFALLAFVLGAGLTYLRMAGRATRRVAKPVPHRLVMGGIIPGVVDAPADPLPTETGPEWQIRAGTAVPEASVAPADEPPTGQESTASESVEVAAEADATAEADGAAGTDVTAPADTPAPAEVESAANADAADQPAEPSTSPEPTSTEATSTEPSEPLERQVAAGATTEPPTSSWWAAAFDRGDPGPYPGPLRYSSAWPPAGSRVLDVDDEFAAALGAGAAASAASAALFGTAGRPAGAPSPAAPSTPPEDASTAASVPAEPGEELIKGNRGSMLYHTPDSPWYARTIAEEWFHTEDEAQAAGFSRWNSRVGKHRD